MPLRSAACVCKDGSFLRMTPRGGKGRGGGGGGRQAAGASSHGCGSGGSIIMRPPPRCDGGCDGSW